MLAGLTRSNSVYTCLRQSQSKYVWHCMHVCTFEQFGITSNLNGQTSECLKLLLPSGTD